MLVRGSKPLRCGRAVWFRRREWLSLVAETFGNGRDMRTLWERTREAQAGRVMRLPGRTAEDLVTIETADIDTAAAMAATT